MNALYLLIQAEFAVQHTLLYIHIFVKYTQKGIHHFFAGYGRTIQTIPQRSYTAKWNQVCTITKTNS